MHDLNGPFLAAGFIRSHVHSKKIRELSLGADWTQELLRVSSIVSFHNSGLSAGVL
jgi:hypothetical protein